MQINIISFNALLFSVVWMCCYLFNSSLVEDHLDLDFLLLQKNGKMNNFIHLDLQPWANISVGAVARKVGGGDKENMYSVY